MPLAGGAPASGSQPFGDDVDAAFDLLRSAGDDIDQTHTLFRERVEYHVSPVAQHGHHRAARSRPCERGSIGRQSDGRGRRNHDAGKSGLVTECRSGNALELHA